MPKPPGDFTIAVAWAKKWLPAEHPELAASAMLSLKGAGRPVTPDSVHARLVGTGRARRGTV